FKGLELEDIEASDKKKYRIDYGVKIKDVTSDALKPYYDQLKGNIILKVDNVKATDVETVSTFMNRKGEDKSVNIQMINRMGQLIQIIIQ
ncbi:MAG TPA: serine protease, partial [Flavobacterium sp.]|nr:serine protease [Flavobacterium sp.]